MSNLLQIKKILAKYNKIPKKSLGQNFLVDLGVAKRTAEACAPPVCAREGSVLEIGPGLGILTRELCQLFKKVTAVEIDKAFEPVLKETLGDLHNLDIVFNDILETDLNNLLERSGQIKKIYICANLPYYITTPVILKLVKSPVKFDGITVMVQKEAADKLCSKAGEKNYNAAAAIINYYGTAEKIFGVNQSSFYPQPKVLSSVIKITPREIPLANPQNEALTYKVIEAAFSQRRKTLANAISSGLNLKKEEAADIVKKVTGRENIRGEELDVKAFSDISNLISFIN